jgi:hypothetical protein
MSRPHTAASTSRPLPTWMWLQVERAELIHADDHLRVAGFDVVGAVHQPIQVQDPVLLVTARRLVGLLVGFASALDRMGAGASSARSRAGGGQLGRFAAWPGGGGLGGWSDRVGAGPGADRGRDAMCGSGPVQAGTPARGSGQDRPAGRRAPGRLLHLGELPRCGVPTVAEEATRDLVRAREDTRSDLMGARHRLSKLLLRHGLVWQAAAWTRPCAVAGHPAVGAAAEPRVAFDEA